MAPRLRAGTRRRVGFLLRVLRQGFAIGALIGAANGAGFSQAPLIGAMLGALGGATNGLILFGVVVGAEIFLAPTRLGHAIERLPFLITFAIKLLVYGGLIFLVVGGSLGRQVAGAVAASLLSPDLVAAFHAQTASRPVLMVIAFLLLATGLFALQMSRLVGERTLRDIVLGRYHRSRTEERFFLFVDVVGSTPLAERIGPAAVHRFLRDVFRLVSDPIDDCAGEVHQYVGDEIVITWTVAEGSEGARPIACFFAIVRALEQAAPEFERRFGTLARVHGALHAGPVIAGEVGGSRRAIVYHGDVMNTASRIEQATRDLGRLFLVSADALARLADREGFAFEDLGAQPLRGRAAAMQVYAVTAKPSPARGR